MVQGHIYMDKALIVNNSNTIIHNPLRILIAIAAVFGLRIWSQDVSRSYFQAVENLMSKVRLRAPGEYQLGFTQLWKRLKLLYGLTDEFDYWCEKFTNHMREDLKMIPSTGYLALFTRLFSERLAGITGSYVYDTLPAGTVYFYL